MERHAICDSKQSESLDYGVPPFFFAGKSERSRYEIVPPLLHYYRYSELDDSSFNLWGPLMWQHKKETDSFNVLPIFYHSWGKNEDHVTVLPFFHYGYKGNSNLLINPLFLSARGEEGESTFATYLYARYRGRTKLDMVTPLYWHYEDPDIGLPARYSFLSSTCRRAPAGRRPASFPFICTASAKG